MTRTRRRARPGGVVAAALVVLLAACGGGGGSGSAPGATRPPASTGPSTGATTGPSTGPSAGAGGGPDLGAVKVRLQPIANLDNPLALGVRPGDDALYVAQKGGQVRVVTHGQGGGDPSLMASPLLDLSGQVSTGGEQGLLGLAFSPDGTKLYVDYTDRAGDTQVVEYGFGAGAVDLGSRRQVLTVKQPYSNHNGGEVAFGPDGLFYVGLGDGGSEYDPDNIGQNLGTLLAKILRIDPRPSGGQGYTVPADNPLVGRAGVRPETYAWGLRNPWRFSWDRRTGDLWIGDVGQDKWEEIDERAPGTAAGANFGWSLMDGMHRFKGTNPPGGVLPIFEYGHDQGCAVTGGFVYRGGRIAPLAGAYVFGDYCSGRVWGLAQAGGKLSAQRQLDVGQRQPILSFGEDAAGELYVLRSAGLSRLVAA